MRSSISLLALFSHLVITTPLGNRQNSAELDDILAEYEEVPDVPAMGPPLGEPPAPIPTYDPAAVIASNPVTKRGGCVVNVVSNYAGTVKPDTDTTFLNDSAIVKMALTAPQPSGYSLVSGFQNLQASSRDASYITYWASQIQSYDVNACASQCNSIKGCNSFNIYFERNPKYNFDPSGCPDSRFNSSILIKCAFYGAPITAASASNRGQWSGHTGFHSVIAGSNAYSNDAQAQPGFDGPFNLDNACIISPPNIPAYLDVDTFPGTQPYDPSVCAAGCSQISTFNSLHPNLDGTFSKCLFFDAYMIYDGGNNGKFTCAYFSLAFNSTYATNLGQTRAAGVYTIGHSNTYKITGVPFFGT